MAGVGKILKQALNMRRPIEALQIEQDAWEPEVMAGVVGRPCFGDSGEYRGPALDRDSLREGEGWLSEAMLAAIKDSAGQAKAADDRQMQKMASASLLQGVS